MTLKNFNNKKITVAFVGSSDHGCFCFFTFHLIPIENCFHSQICQINVNAKLQMLNSETFRLLSEQVSFKKNLVINLTFFN